MWADLSTFPRAGTLFGAVKVPVNGRPGEVPISGIISCPVEGRRKHVCSFHQL